MKRVAIFYCKRIKDHTCIGCAKCYKGISEKNGEFAQHKEAIEVVSMTDCGDCPGLLVPRVTMILGMLDGLGREVDAIHLGTCIKMAYEHGNCPIDPDEVKLKTEIENFLKAINQRKDQVHLEMTPEAKELYDVYESIVEDKIQKGQLGIREGYMGQLPNLAVRLACIYRISRLSIQEIQNPTLSPLIVEKVDIEKAITYAIFWYTGLWF